MDTTRPSPKFASLKAPGLLAIALSAAVGLWLAAITTEIAAAETPPQTTEAVTYGDLDLATTEGAQALLKRIDLAAKRICGPEPSHSPLEPRAAAYYRDCVTASADAAVARVGSPVMQALHEDTQSTGSTAIAAR
jgi:UrcA family protein